MIAVHGVNGKRSRGRNRANEAAADPIDFGPLAGWVGFNLRVAQEAAFQSFSRRSLEIGQNPGRFATLTLIDRNPGISQTELSQAAGRDKSSLTPVLDNLVRRGLVERKRMDRDRRTYRLTLTPAGRKVLASMMRCARGHERLLDEVIGVRDRARFIEICKKIANIKTDRPRSSGGIGRRRSAAHGGGLNDD
jgi:DNA-binding MarR family transcriptional regulator